MEVHGIAVLSAFTLFGIVLVSRAIHLWRKNKIDFRGKSPIRKNLYIIGKAVVFASFIFILLQARTDEINFSIFSVPDIIKWIAVIILVTGVLVISVSYIQLGSNLRLGLPQDEESTSLQKNGIYKISRNPIYIGFFLMLLASSLYVINPFNWVCAIMGVIIHHKQILAEEVFLKQRFGKEWTDYKNKVNRYL